MARLYFTVNGLKTLTAMRYELAKAGGDDSWLSAIAHSDQDVHAEYARITQGWVEEID